MCAQQLYTGTIKDDTDLIDLQLQMLGLSPNTIYAHIVNDYGSDIVNNCNLPSHILTQFSVIIAGILKLFICDFCFWPYIILVL